MITLISSLSLMIQTSSGILRNLQNFLENVQERLSGLQNNFGKSSEIFGKRLENFGKSSKTPSSLVRYCSCHSNIKFISSRLRVISSICYTVLCSKMIKALILFISSPTVELTQGIAGRAFTYHQSIFLLHFWHQQALKLKSEFIQE